MQDLWAYEKHRNEQGARNTVLVIPTNGVTTRGGGAVMGAGLAQQAAQRYPKLPAKLAEKLVFGNNLYWFPEELILTFPTKHHWRDHARLDLIEQSAAQLCEWWHTERPPEIAYVAIPKVGAGLGGLNWQVVKRVLSKAWFPEFHHNVIFVE